MHHPCLISTEPRPRQIPRGICACSRPLFRRGQYPRSGRRWLWPSRRHARRRHRAAAGLACGVSAVVATKVRRCWHRCFRPRPTTRARAGVREHSPSRVRARRRRRRRRAAAGLACGVSAVVATKRPCYFRRSSRSPCRRRVAAARRSSRRRSRALLAPARSTAAFRDGSNFGRRSTRRLLLPALNAARLLRRASLRGHTPVAATARRPHAVELLLLAARRSDARARFSRPLGVSCAVLLCAVIRPWPRRLDGRPPSSHSCSPLVATTLARAARARSVGSRALLAPARSAAAFATARRRASLDAAAFASALDAARFLRRAPLRGRSPVAATARRPPAVESRLLAARRGDARARCSRLLGRPPRSRRPDTRPPLDAAAFASALDAARLLRRAPLRGHSPVAATARRPPAVESRLLAARRGAARARCSRPLGRPPRSRRPDTRPPLDAAAFASALDAARLLRRAPLRSHSPVAATVRRPPAVESRLLAARRGVARERCSRPLGRPPRSRRPDTRPPLDAAVFASALDAAHLLRRAPLRGHARGRNGSTAARRRVAAARRLARRARARCSRALGRPPHSRRLSTRPPLDAAVFASALDAARLLRRAPLRGHSPVAATARRPPAVESPLLTARRGDARARCWRPLGRPPRSRRHTPWPRRLDGRPPSSRRLLITCAHAQPEAPDAPRRSGLPARRRLAFASGSLNAPQAAAQ